jgi:hypothetical protein
MPHLFMPLIGLSILAINVQPHFDVRFRPRMATSANLSLLIAPQSPKIPRPLMRVVRTRTMLISSGALCRWNVCSMRLISLTFHSLVSISSHHFPLLKVILSSQSLQQPDPLRLGKKQWPCGPHAAMSLAAFPCLEHASTHIHMVDRRPHRGDGRSGFHHL